MSIALPTQSDAETLSHVVHNLKISEGIREPSLR